MSKFLDLLIYDMDLRSWYFIYLIDQLTSMRSGELSCLVTGLVRKVSNTSEATCSLQKLSLFVNAVSSFSLLP